MRKFGYLTAILLSIWFACAVADFVPAVSLQRIALSVPTIASPPRPRVVYTYTQADFECLHDNVFYEARGESPEGMAMVAIVTVVRSRMPQFPDTICGVVHESHQFSWTLKKPTPNFHNEIELGAWNMSAMIAQNILLNNEGIDELYRNLAYYHNTSVHPKWADKMQREFVVGNHIFYSKDFNEAPSFVLR